MSPEETCLREHDIEERELKFAGTIECIVEIDCVNDDCGPHDITYHDELMFA